MHARRLPYIIISLLLLLGAQPNCNADDSQSIILENSLFRYVIGTNGWNQAFIDLATGTNYSRTDSSAPCAIAWKSGQSHVATSARRQDGRILIRFDKLDTELSLKAVVHPTFVVFSVESVTGEQPDKVWFINVLLNVEGKPGEAFGGCALALNLKTRVDALPALQRDLRATAEQDLGLAGARAALVAGPLPRVLPAIQEALAAASELPLCKVAGPWAAQQPGSRASYLFNFGALTLSNLTEWIATVQSLGFSQIEHHGGGNFFRFGDFQLNQQAWPGGWGTWEKEVLPRLRKAGIASVFHTYAFFIDKRSKYVSPVPDPRLDAFRAFTLAAPMAAEATEITVNERTAEVSLITGFNEQNSVTLHIGDELVTFGGATKEPPWKFTGVVRGVHGTKPAGHEKGVRARHLKELFGLFVPDVESTLFEEIAANHAEVVNRCGFEGIYLDAIDGASILRGPDKAWYWGGKFVVEIQRRLNQPVGMEMSAMWHHFWQYRTRWQAWDFPVRGHVRFNDIHAQSINGGLLLPLHLGWWSLHSFNPPQVEPTYPEVIETLGARLVGWDAGASLTAAVGPASLADIPSHRRSVDILRACEELRRSEAYSASQRARLRQPGSEFGLLENRAGQKRFREAKTHAHVAAPAQTLSLAWQMTNAFAAQPVTFRIETLMAASTTRTSSIVLADFSKAAAPEWKQSQAPGVSLALSSDGPTAWLAATNQGLVPRRGAWARLERQLDPPLNLSQHQALAIEVQGDGSGALLAIRMESPAHLSFGAVADRYLLLDFTGPRQFSLVETESSRWSDYTWNDDKSPYNIYRETINFGMVNKVSVWLQNVPMHREVKVALGPIRAVPMQAISLKNPVLTVGGKKLTIRAEVPAGGWIEGRSPSGCQVYGPKGEPIGRATVEGEWPEVPHGPLDLTFACEAQEVPPRSRVVIFTTGDEI